MDIGFLDLIFENFHIYQCMSLFLPFVFVLKAKTGREDPGVQEGEDTTMESGQES